MEDNLCLKAEEEKLDTTWLGNWFHNETTLTKKEKNMS